MNERGGFVCVQIIIQLISGAVTAKQNSGGLESSMTPSDCEYSCLSYHTEHVHVKTTSTFSWKYYLVAESCVSTIYFSHKSYL